MSLLLNDPMSAVMDRELDVSLPGPSRRFNGIGVNRGERFEGLLFRGLVTGPTGDYLTGNGANQFTIFLLAIAGFKDPPSVLTIRNHDHMRTTGTVAAR